MTTRLFDPLTDVVDLSLRDVMTLEQARFLASRIRKVILESGHGEVIIVIQHGKPRYVRTQVSDELPPAL